MLGTTKDWTTKDWTTKDRTTKDWATSNWAKQDWQDQPGNHRDSKNERNNRAFRHDTPPIRAKCTRQAHHFCPAVSSSVFGPIQPFVV